MRRYTWLSIILITLLTMPIVRECCLPIIAPVSSHCSHSSNDLGTAACAAGMAIAIETRSYAGIPAVTPAVSFAAAPAQASLYDWDAVLVNDLVFSNSPPLYLRTNSLLI